jgi:hypothetical protein
MLGLLKEREVSRDGSERNQFRSLDAAQLVLSGFAHIYKQEFVATVEALFELTWLDLQIVHR